jgi:UDP-arabinose 4-epimerase
MVDFSDPKRRPRYLSKVVMVALLTAMCVVMLTQPPCHRRTPSVVSSTPTLLCLGSTSNCLN